MSKVVEEVKTEKIEEVETSAPTISINVEAGSPQKIDFSKAPENEGLMSAVIILVGRNEASDKGKLTLKVQYKDVQDINDPDHSPIVTKEDVVATFEEGDNEQKETSYTFTAENEATFTVEGEGSCNIIGYFSPFEDDEEEEEEEEEEETKEKDEKKDE